VDAKRIRDRLIRSLGGYTQEQQDTTSQQLAQSRTYIERLTYELQNIRQRILDIRDRKLIGDGIAPEDRTLAQIAYEREDQQRRIDELTAIIINPPRGPDGRYLPRKDVIAMIQPPVEDQ
jgi:hypothetical protein